MAIEHHHYGAGCEAVVSEEGNELFDLHVHFFYCPNKDKFTVNFPGGVSKRACEYHAAYWSKNSKGKVIADVKD